MSLEAATGTPLDRRPAVPRPPEGERIENPKEIRQAGENWCWAASIQSARRTIGKGVRVQHLIAANHLGCKLKLCCRKRPAGPCDQTIDRDELLDLWQSEGFSRMTYRQETFDFNTIKSEIKAGRLVLLELDNRHVILVYGWDVDSLNVQNVYVLDTARNAPGSWPFKDLANYDSGKWGPWTGTGLGIQYDGSAEIERCP